MIGDCSWHSLPLYHSSTLVQDELQDSTAGNIQYQRYYLELSPVINCAPCAPSIHRTFVRTDQNISIPNALTHQIITMPTSPPPLPATLSSRLQSSIDPLTGTCRHHPQVKLCELVQNNTRWVVRRKICYKCGTRGNGKFHKPGVAVKTGDKEKEKSAKERRGSLDVRERTRSVSASRRGSITNSSRRSRSVSRERSRTRLSASVNNERPVRTRLSSSSRELAAVMPYVAPPPVVVPATSAVVVAQDEDEDFDESDPIIYIPALSPDEELPPPPPRTEEENERHAERLEVRRANEKKKEKKEGEARRVAESKQLSAPMPSVTHKHKTRELEPPIDTTSPMPSATAMALLESHPKKSKTPKHSSPAAHPDEDEASETSSISTASAKMYQLEPDELRAHHPELEGVERTHHLQHSEPPKEIIPSRSRSLSRPKVKKAVDPEECQIVVFEEKKERRKKTSTEKSLVTERKSGERRRKTISEEKKRSSVVEWNSRSVVEPPRSSRNTVSEAPKASKSVHERSSSSRRLSKTVPSSQIKDLSASSARISRQRERVSTSKSVHGRPTRRSTMTSRKTRSASRKRSSSRSRKLIEEATDVCSILEQSTKISRSRSKHTSGTTCTQPLSVSSDEILKDATSKLEATVLYKKRAKKKSDDKSKSMPVAHIACSSDEKSHASSISSSSTIEESFVYSEDERDGGAGDKSKKSGAKASMMLKDVKGGAVGLASKGRSTLMGLKGTSKKWQSALFM